MTKTLLAIALLGIGMPSLALAADFVGDPPTDTAGPADPGSDWGFYIQGYGGLTAPSIAGFDEIFNNGVDPVEHDFFDEGLTSGPAFGASFGVTTPIDGLSVGVDVMHTHTDLPDFNEFNATVDTLTIMGTVEGAYHLSSTFDLYATGGVGAMEVTYHDTDKTSTPGWTPAYQVAVGLRAKVTDNLSLFSEIKHQDVFAPANVGDAFDNGPGESVEIATGHTAVTGGVRFNF